MKRDDVVVIGMLWWLCSTVCYCPELICFTLSLTHTHTHTLSRSLWTDMLCCAVLCQGSRASSLSPSQALRRTAQVAF